MPTTAADLGLVAPEQPKTTAAALGLHEPHTTAPGVAASITRGLAPIAAGAGVGALAGAPFAGVGAVPGAIAGGTAAAGTELITALYNLLAPHLGGGLPTVETPSSATGKLLDVAGIKRPSTTAEKLAETTAGDIAAFAPGGAAIRAGERALAAGKPAAETIGKKYFQGIRPSSAGIESAGDLERYTGNVNQAVRRIVQVEGDKLPGTVGEFSQAIGRAKTATYNAYHPMAVEAEKAGARVDAMPAIERMKQLAADPLADPAARTAARRLLKTVPSTGRISITPSRAEQLIADLNERSGDFSQTARGAATAFREAGTALREKLIGAVEGAGFPQYGALRRDWGSLAEIEPDVARATVVGLRQGSGVGLTEGIAAGTAAAGHPGIATGLEATKLLSRHFGSPDKAVQRLFETAAGRTSLRQGTANVARGVGASAVPLGYGAATAVPQGVVDLKDKIARARQDAAAGQIPP